jgi:hypothetical protein
MKSIPALAGAFLASAALAEGEPFVNENTGDLGYRYAFGLPRARGRHQPTPTARAERAEHRR